MLDYAKEMGDYLKRLYPLTRSITGKGNRETLKIVQEIIPLEILEYPSGQEVYDWTIPKEWDIQEAWIKNSKGEKIIDMKNSNLHVMSYSQSVHKTMKLDELKEHLYYLENLPNAIPYRTSYYNENWGFCLSLEQYKQYFNEDEEYTVFIDSSKKDGSLTIGELLIPGKSKKEYLISCYNCHPSMTNDSLSGVLVSAYLAKELLQRKNELEHSYRFIFIPETIGAIAYCANNEEAMQQIDNGLVVTTCAGLGTFGYKQSWDKDDFINSMVEEVFNENEIEFATYPFDIHGSDERQYSSQGFKINCVTISKDKYYEYDYYHTSLDDLDFVTPQNLNLSLNVHMQLLNKMDKNISYMNNYPNCEVMLSKHDLYPKVGGAQLPGSTVTPLDIRLWLLFYCDGKKTLYEISKLVGANIIDVYNEAKVLASKNIISSISK